MDRNWQRRSALNKYKAPREDFKVHGESWVNGARELSCYRATTGVAFRSKPMTRQAQDTKQYGPHRLYNPRTIFNRSCSLGLNNNTKKIQTGQK
jgi:hypothetical protein